MEQFKFSPCAVYFTNCRWRICLRQISLGSWSPLMKTRIWSKSLVAPSALLPGFLPEDTGLQEIMMCLVLSSDFKCIFWNLGMNVRMQWQRRGSCIGRKAVLFGEESKVIACLWFLSKSVSPNNDRGKEHSLLPFPQGRPEPVIKVFITIRWGKSRFGVLTYICHLNMPVLILSGALHSQACSRRWSCMLCLTPNRQYAL